MKIVIKNMNDNNQEYLVYLKTDDDVSVTAEFATKETVDYVIEELSEQSGEDNIEVIWPEEPQKTIPLILVFYLDRHLMANNEIVSQYTNMINDYILDKNANMMAFFMATDGEERIECINPLIATDEEKKTITELIDDVKNKFDINKND